MKNWKRDLNRYFSKEDIPKASKHIKGRSTSLVIREISINQNEIPLRTYQDGYNKKAR